MALGHPLAKEVSLFNQIRMSGKPNFCGSRVPAPSGLNVKVYLDDFNGVCPPESEAAEPDFQCLGVMSDIVALTMEVTPERVRDTIALTCQWLEKLMASKREVQHLVGDCNGVGRSEFKVDAKYLDGLLSDLSLQEAVNRTVSTGSGRVCWEGLWITMTSTRKVTLERVQDTIFRRGLWLDTSLVLSVLLSRLLLLRSSIRSSSLVQCFFRWVLVVFWGVWCLVATLLVAGVADPGTGCKPFLTEPFVARVSEPAHVQYKSSSAAHWSSPPRGRISPA